MDIASLGVMTEANEDDELIGLFVQRYPGQEELASLRRRNEELEAELKRAFATIDTQASTLRRYRTLLRQTLDRNTTTAAVASAAPPLPAPSTLPPPPPAPPLPPPPSRILPRSVMEHCTQVYTLEGPVEVLLPTGTSSTESQTRTNKRSRSITPPPPPPAMVKAPAPVVAAVPTPSAPAAPLVRYGDLLHDKRIRFLTRERSDGFPEVYTSNIIWQVIVKFFNSNANANLMDEHMIIKEAGSCLLGDTNKPFLTRTMIQQYFNHAFTFQDSDQTMVVRTRMVQGQPVWMVFIPDWLKSEWRTAGKPQTKP